MSGPNRAVEVAVRSEVEAGLAPGKIISRGSVAAIPDVGNQLEGHEYYVPEMPVAARAIPRDKASSSRFPLQVNHEDRGDDLVGAGGLEPSTSRM